MVGCPRCGGSSAVQITIDGARSDQGPGESPRWRAHCDECGADWAFRD